MGDRIEPLKASDLEAYVEIMAAAYPGLNITSDKDHENMRDRLASTYDDPATTVYGMKHDDRLVAGMILYDFLMNVRGAMLPAGGLGSLAVDMFYRKRKAAKAMVSYYLAHYRQKGAPLALLYPFRTDFYRRMGFGYGTKMNRYVFKPERIRVSTSERSHVEYLGEEDADAVLACFDRYTAETHGMIPGSQLRIKQMLANRAIVTAGYYDEGQLKGYMIFDFERRGHFLKNDLRVKQLIYQDSVVLGELLAFLRSLADQFEWIVIDTQDSSFHHLLDDPRSRADELIPSVYHESNTQGVGLMYRVIDTTSLFNGATGIRFGTQSLTLKISLSDSFITQNDGSLLIRFEDGQSSIVQNVTYDAAVYMDVSDFSSMIMGAITLEQLVAYGLAQFKGPGLLKAASDLLATNREPVCMTAF